MRPLFISAGMLLVIVTVRFVDYDYEDEHESGLVWVNLRNRLLQEPACACYAF